MNDLSKKGSNKKREGNEKYYPFLFLVVLPLIGFFSSREYNLFGGDSGKGTVIGLAVGVVFYGIWKYLKGEFGRR